VLEELARLEEGRLRLVCFSPSDLHPRGTQPHLRKAARLLGRREPSSSIVLLGSPPLGRKRADVRARRAGGERVDVHGASSVPPVQDKVL
jgi:hypothetical protein